jgi:hypothetical protein
MPHPPEVQDCKRQLAAAPSQLILQAPPQASMLQEPPALQLSMVQLPLVQVLSLHVGLCPAHCMEQLPSQFDIVQSAPVHGIEQAPDWEQSMVHSAPAAQVVWQLPAS